MKRVPDKKFNFKETTYITPKLNKFYRVFTICTYVIGLFVLVLSIQTGGTYFSNMESLNKILLITAFIIVYFIREKEPMLSDIEFQFFDDCLVIFRSERFYEKNKKRRERLTIRYQDIEDIEIFRDSIWIEAKTEEVIHNYDENGKISRKISEKNIVNGTNINLCKEDIILLKEAIEESINKLHSETIDSVINEEEQKQ